MSNYYNRMTELACWVASMNVGEYDKDDIQQMVNAVGKEVSRDFYIKYGQKYGANVDKILTYIEEAQDGYWDAEGFEAETFEAMIEMITEKEMMQRINHVKEQLILTQGEGDMRFQEFRKWVRNQISEWYDNNEDYKKEIEEAVERLHERFGAEDYEGHTPTDQWTTYTMGVHSDGRLSDKAYHAVRIGREGFDLPITKGADARLVADAPKLLAKSRVLDKIIAWHERNQLQGESIQYELDRINWMLENPDKDYDEYPYTYDGGFREGFGAESERTFTVSKGPKRMYIVVEYNDGKELFLDGDGQKQFMEELAEAEATGDEMLVEKIFGVGSDYHGIAEEVVEAEEFEAHQFEGLPQFVKYDTSETECCGKDMEIWEENSGDGRGSLFYTYCPLCHDYDVNDSPYDAESFEAQGYDEIEVNKYVDIDWETDPHPHPYDDDINKRQIFNEVSGYVEDAVERRGRDSGFGDIEVEDEEENEVVEKTVRVEYDYHLQGESFEATKGIDTYSQPFEELRIKPSKAKVGILLASIVASGVWFVNKMKED